MLQDKVIGKGVVEITVRKPGGREIKTVVNNLVVTVGRNHIADQLSALLEAPMSHMAIGSGTTPQAIADTALETEINRKAFTSKDPGTGADANKVIYVADWAAGEGTGAITEAGIFNSAAAGVMLTRTTFAVKNKDVGDSLSIQWTLTITG